MNLERIAYLVLGLVTLAWLGLAILETDLGSTEAVLGWATVGGFALLLFKALRDRAASAEDRHYDQSVEK